MSRTSTGLALLGGVAVVLAACSSSGPTDGPEDSTPSAARSCPDAAAAAFSWPAPVPADLPKPAGATVVETRRLASGGVVVQLRVPDSLHGQVVFVRSRFPAAKIVLGRGDAEQDEADIPLRHAALSGQLRLRSAGECSTTWILTVTPG